MGDLVRRGAPNTEVDTYLDSAALGAWRARAE